MAKNRFTAAKEKMDSNYDESIDNEEQNQNLDESSGNSEESQEVVSKPEQEAEPKRTESKVEKPRQTSKPAAATAAAINLTSDQRTTRKTTTMPLVLALAVKELKDRRNLAQQKGKGRTTDDDVIVEALQLYFNQSGEFNESLNIAATRLRNYS